MRRPFVALAALSLAALAAGCATPPPASDPEALAEFHQNNDPLEPLNRASYQVDLAIDTLVVRPAAEAYGIFVPEPVRDRVRNVLDNLRTPVIFANDVLQGQPRRAGDSLARFAINSTLGVLGVFDVATDMGYPAHYSDFGQTMGRWGMEEGHFLWIPVIGPMNARDLLGFGVDIAMDPWGWFGQSNDPWVNAFRVARPTLVVLDTRQGLIGVLDDIRKNSVDPYATLRSAYRQRRQALIDYELDTFARDPLGRAYGGN